MKNVIYYFSGTGNSMRAARVIAKHLGDTEIISMRCDPETVPAAGYERVGFVFPVYHWTMPAPAVAFVEKLAIDPNAYVFGCAMPSLICGAALETLAGVLAKKGISIDYGNLVHNVASYAIVYPPFPPAKLVVPAAERKLQKIAAEIKNKVSREYPKASRLVQKRREKVMNPYLELQKYADEPFTISADCISCGLCSRVCPCHNIELKEGKPTFLHHCANCMACVVNCPKRAIGYELKKEDIELLKKVSKKTPVVRIMGLPKKRKLYRNPYISAADLAKDRETV